jgi:hypothetical protein
MGPVLWIAAVLGFVSCAQLLALVPMSPEPIPLEVEPGSDPLGPLRRGDVNGVADANCGVWQSN